jgi:hypothetical protein
MSGAVEVFTRLWAERELTNRGVTLQNLDKWESRTYPQDLLRGDKCILYKIECRAKDGSDSFIVQAVLNKQKDHIETAEIQVITTTTQTAEKEGK